MDRDNSGMDADGHPQVTAEFKNALSAYRGSRPLSSLWQLVNTLFLFALLWAAMWWSLSIGYWLTLLLALPTAGLLARLFILQHDCGHGSFFPSTLVNQIVGGSLSILTLTPYQCWRRQHALHHATNAQLDHRGMGDVTTLTVSEYSALSGWEQWKYRLYRHPLVLFGVGPFLYFAFLQRLTNRIPGNWGRERNSIHLTNLMLLVVFGIAAWIVGPLQLAMIQVPVLAIAASVGTWLFYVQHQFNPTYWQHDEDWNYHEAALHGSSFLDLPGPLRWMTANIGFHHVHHLDSRIPNYALPRCHAALPELQTTERLTLRSSWHCFYLRLWDEEKQKMVSFQEANLGKRTTAREPSQCGSN